MDRAPAETIWHLTNGWVVSRCLQLVAECEVADHLDDDPHPAAVLAGRCGLDADALERVLRLLSAHGVFARAEGGGYAHTEASRLLRSDHPRSMRALGRMHNLPQFRGCYAEFAHALRTGRPAAEVLGPGGVFGMLQLDPPSARIFDEAMAARAKADIAAVVTAADFGRFATVADVGGGGGHLLRAVLESAPETSGILFDLPDVVGAVTEVPARMSLHAGSFFTDELPAADAYVLMEVLHDWTDAETAQLLAAIRRAAAPGARVLVVENLLGDEVDVRGWTLDVLMLAVTGGRERTAAELAALLHDAGFGDPTVTPTGGRLKVLEATAY